MCSCLQLQFFKKFFALIISYFITEKRLGSQELKETTFQFINKIKRKINNKEKKNYTRNNNKHFIIC